MSITEELRDWSMDAHAGWIISRVELDALHAIADRIDKEHAKAVERARMDGMDATFGNGWVQLPKDADGVPIHVGDELTDGEYTFTVYELAAYGDGSWSIRNEDGNAWAACDVTHHKPDSWERIIKDALTSDRGDAYAVSMGMMRELVERCRRLAGEGN